MPQSQELLSCSYDPRGEPCLLSEQGEDLTGRYREYLPRAPPPSPTKLTPLTCTEPNEAGQPPFCALHLVDRKIQAHQSRLSLMQHGRISRSYSPALWSHDGSGQEFKCFDETMHRMVAVRQVSLALDHDEMTPTDPKCHSSRSSGTNTLVNDLPTEKEVGSYSTAIGVHAQSKMTTSLMSGTRFSSSKSPSFGFFNLRSRREAIDVPSRFHFPSPNTDASGPRPPVTGSHISSLTPLGSSAISDIAVSTPECKPPEHKHKKTKSWPGPCGWLPAAGNISSTKAATRAKARKCKLTCACRRERAESFNDGGMPGCANCLPRSRTCFSNKYGLNLQPLPEHAREEEAMDEKPSVRVEEERSYFSDCSTDEEDDGEEMASNAWLFNSLGRLNRRSKTRLSWGNLFSKP